MNREQIINKLLEQVSHGLTWAADQAPDVVQQLLLYNFWSSLLWDVVSLGILLFLIRVMYSMWTAPPFSERDWWPVFFMLGIPSAVVAFIAVICNTSTVLYIGLAPKAWVLEYLAKLAS